jgi:hypothetical protein
MTTKTAKVGGRIELSINVTGEPTPETVWTLMGVDQRALQHPLCRRKWDAQELTTIQADRDKYSRQGRRVR